jgi:type II secretory pathway component PulF
MISRSTVALACVDRFALCSRHVRIRRLNQRHIAIKLVIIVSILWMIVPIHVIIFTNIQMPGERCGDSGIYLIIYSVYAAIVTSIPLAIMITFSFLAVRNLQHSRIQIHPNGINLPTRIRKRDVQLMIILIGEVVVYFLSTVWFPIYTIYFTITVNIPKSTDRLAIEEFIRYLTFSFLLYINSCSIFYIHLLASKPFRQECKRLVLSLFKHDQNNQTNQNNRVFRRTSEVSNIRNQLNEIYDPQQIDDNPDNNNQ